MRDVMARDGDSEVINISLQSERKWHNGFLFSEKQPFEMKEESPSGKELYRSKAKWWKRGCFVAVFLGIPAEDIFNYIFTESPLNCLAFAHFNDSEKHQEGRNVVKMLHVFHVDLGTIYTFEMELAMERWEKKHDVVHQAHTVSDICITCSP